MLLAIDPGLCTGWAIFDDGFLTSCGLNAWLPRRPEVVVIERPQVYPFTSAKQSNDLITLAVQVGRYTERLESLGAKVEHVFPHTWKGNVPKHIHHVRIFDSLRDCEIEVLPTAAKGYIDACRLATQGQRNPPTAKWNNMFDAVGLGSWKLDRG